MLIKVKRLNYNGNYAYAPPQEDAVINTEEIVSAVPTEARGEGPFLLVHFTTGDTMTMVGTLDMLLPAAQDRR